MSTSTKNTNAGLSVTASDDNSAVTITGAGPTLYSLTNQAFWTDVQKSAPSPGSHLEDLFSQLNDQGIVVDDRFMNRLGWTRVPRIAHPAGETISLVVPTTSGTKYEPDSLSTAGDEQVSSDPGSTEGSKQAQADPSFFTEILSKLF